MRPVDTVLDGCPTYYDVIKNPMDLRTIRENLDARKYTSMDEFAADVRLMLANCFAFNPAGTPVHVMGKELETAFEREWTKATTAALLGARQPERPAVNVYKREAADREMESALPGSSQMAATIKSIRIPRTKQANKSASPGAGQLKLKNVKGRQSTPPGKVAESLDALDDPDAIMRYLDQTTGPSPPASAPTPTPAPTPAPAVAQLRVCARILLRLQALPSAMEFMAPVDPVKQNVPTYFDIIKNPMDLGTIRKKLDHQKYRTTDEFRDDLQLVLHNCFLFNVPNTYAPVPVVDDEVMSERAHARARTILTKLKQGDNAWPFLKPVDPVALGVPTYFVIVKNPMDFSTIQRKLTKKVYRYVADFVCDLRLMLDDCFLFNPAETPVNDAGKAVERVARAMLEGEGWTRWF
ncbi:hypothetical protein FBU59_005094 [Linderina macrospora]|uniref:Uncharacterized protein n=1 Tax=Linderina macrospora TaxID=4868 RepID=A0ACC1J3J2_9FUNG|nr:hypothetical protein FBU59_005094 [Linderina macrospora]